MQRNYMPKNFPIAAQRQILKLERDVLKLEQKLASAKKKYEKQIADLKTENHKLRTRRFIVPEEQRAELIARRDKALEANAHLRSTPTQRSTRL